MVGRRIRAPGWRTVDRESGLWLRRRKRGGDAGDTATLRLVEGHYQGCVVHGRDEKQGGISKPVAMNFILGASLAYSGCHSWSMF